jgi:UDP-N-acetylglucosamine acyltransferase
MQAHETAVIHPGAKIGEGVQVGAYSIIEADTQIGDRTVIGDRVSVKQFTRVGPDCRIHTGAVLGDFPQDTKFKGETSYLTIGKGNVIREYATLHRASGQDAETVIGDHNMFMAQTHVAHNCRVGSYVNMANLATLGGFVQVGDRAFLGGLMAAHQFVRIGDMAMVGGGSILLEDAPPYMTVAGGYRPPVVSLNTVGLMRAGLSSETRSQLKKAYRILIKSGATLSQAAARIRSELIQTPEIAHLAAFLESSERGVCAGR